MHEEAILAWVLDLYVSTPDVIESVDRKTLQVLINDVEHLAVFFCKSSLEFVCTQLTTVLVLPLTRETASLLLQTAINAIPANRY